MPKKADLRGYLICAAIAEKEKQDGRKSFQKSHDAVYAAQSHGAFGKAAVYIGKIQHEEALYPVKEHRERYRKHRYCGKGKAEGWKGLPAEP